MTKKQSRSLAKSTAKKPLEASTAAKKSSEEVAPTSKKPVENVSTSISKKKKQPVINVPPESPSAKEQMETEEDEEEEIDSSSEEEDEPKPDSGKNPQSSAPIVAATVIPSSDSESGSETEGGESDSEPEPASTKPPPPPAASPRTLRKRTIEATASPDANPTITKQAKTQTETDTAKKGLFQRVWSEQDEIALLEAMLAFKEEIGKNTSEDMSVVYKMVKDSVYCKGKSFNQFSSKVTKLKSKYLGKSGVEPNYTKAHDLKCLDLCEKIWVTNAIVKSEKNKKKVKDAIVNSEKKKKVEDTIVKSEKKKKKKKKVEDVSVKLDDGVKGDSDWFERSYLFRAMMDLGVVDDESLKKKWSLVPVEIKKKLEDKFKMMEASDYERLILKTKFLHEVSSAISNA
ncbi:putative transcription factor [Cardamine amara subsp. amara]|uniref:Transcription factor n=1 Tax=Cardamine amara subsp. amara TaxID=228776 RepID=A0ABD1B6H5_CARAN